MEKLSAPTPSDLPVAILGGGVTGLSAAYALQRAGRAVRLFERSARLGGVVQSDHVDGWLIERGPNSFLEGSGKVSALLSELNLEAERTAASPAAKNRYLVRAGQLIPLPRSPGGFFSTRLFSAGTKIKFLSDFFSRPRRRKNDVSIAQLVRDHFGSEAVEQALSPFVSGIYAGDAQKLSARWGFPKVWAAEQNCGSILRGLARARQARGAGEKKKPAVISFRAGLQSLPDALAQRIAPDAIELEASVENVLPGPPWKIVWRRGSETQTENFSAVISALPAASLARLPFGSLGERPLAGLDGIEYPPLASVFLGFRREDIGHALDGFGALVPPREAKNILGTIFSSSLFPARAPAGHVALTVMMGGSLRPDLPNRSENELVQLALSDLQPLLQVRGTPVFQRVQIWPHAIPQYNLGYEHFLDRIAEAEKQFPQFFVAGQIRDGISLPQCVESGLRVAEKILSRESR